MIRDALRRLRRPLRPRLSDVPWLAAGAAAGVLLERELVHRRRLPAPQPDAEPLEGERSEVPVGDGAAIAVETFGPADGIPVVCSHGWSNTGRVWQEQVRQVGDRVRLITWDQPGHGRSSEPTERRYTLDVLGDALGAVLDAHAPDGPVVLVGHSLGGIASLNLLRRRPDVGERLAGLVLLSTLSRVPYALDAVVDGLAAVAHRLRTVLDAGGRALLRAGYASSSDLSHLLIRFVALGPDASTWAVDQTEQLLLEADPDVLAGLSAPILSTDEDAGLRDIDAPTVVVVGGSDRLTLPAYNWRLAHRIPGADLLTLPGVGHMTPLEASEVVSSLLLELARGSWGGADQ